MKFIRIFVLIIVILNLIYVNTFAADNILKQIIDGARNFIDTAEKEDITGALSGTIKGLAAAGLAIGTIVAICAGIVIAINTMANGAHGKAELKEALTPYIIGCIVLFAAWTIWAAVVQVMESTIQ